MLVTGLAGLEVWCQRMTETYPGVRISNMTEAWRDGLGFAAIIHRHRPDLIDFGSLKPGDIQRYNAMQKLVICNFIQRAK